VRHNVMRGATHDTGRDGTACDGSGRDHLGRDTYDAMAWARRLGTIAGHDG
jgi:hypothetical protein